MSKDLPYLFAKKRKHEPIVMVTCYDYPTAQIEEEAGMDIIFVGDSVGTNMLGYAAETEVTMEDMLHHLKAVRRGVQEAYLLVDLPAGSYQTPEMAVENARRLHAHGPDGIKLEGGREQVEIVRALVAQGFEVCGHIGFTPQTLGTKGHLLFFLIAECGNEHASALFRFGQELTHVAETITSMVIDFDGHFFDWRAVFGDRPAIALDSLLQAIGLMLCFAFAVALLEGIFIHKQARSTDCEPSRGK